MPSFSGTPGDDIFTGGVGADTATGGAGNDSLSGADGPDVLAGGSGADTLDGGAGDDILYSGDPPPPGTTVAPLDTGTEVDTLIGGDGSDRIHAGYGDNVDGGPNGAMGDYLYISFLGAPSGVTADFGLASQTIGGGTITGIENISYIQGSQFGDNINARAAYGSYSDFTIIHGMGGADTLTAGYYTDSIFGDDGNDVVDGRPSQYLSVVDGGAGDDTLYTNPNTSAAAYGGDGNDTIYANSFTHGGAGNDTIIMQQTYYPGGVFGDDGDDQITAAVSGNYMAGGAGADTVTGDSGADILVSADFAASGYYVPTEDMGLEHDKLAGGAGDDNLAIGYGDDADGGPGTDTLRLSLGGLTHGIDFDTSGIVSGGPVTLGGGTIQNIETLLTLRGTEFADTLRLQTQNVQLTVNAGAGDDVIISQHSSVSVQGGAGDDRFVSGNAADTFDGGSGTDTIDYSGYASAVTVDLAAGTGAGGDTLLNVESVIGSAFGDTLSGTSGANSFDGGGGIDTVSYASASGGVTVSLALSGQAQNTGGAGTDTLVNIENLTGSASGDNLTGGGGDNTLNGGGGADTLAGAGGRDVLTGGSGADLFKFATGDSGTVAGVIDSVTDWTSADFLGFGAGVATSANYLEASAADYGAALALANAQIAGGAVDYVAVSVGSDVVVFADTAADNGTADDAVVLTGATLADISFSNLGGAAPPPSNPPPSNPPPSNPPPSNPPPSNPPPSNPPPSNPPTGSGGAGVAGTVVGNMDAAHLGHLLGAEITTATGSNLTLTGAGGIGLHLGGSAFTYDLNEQMTGGQVATIDYSDVTAAGVFHTSITGPGISAAPFGGWVQADATQLAFSTILNGDDWLQGGAGADLIRGYGGNDLLDGSGGNDTIWGGTGNDQIVANSQANGSVSQTYLRGEDGNDTITGGAGFDDINGNQGNDVAHGNGGDDWVVGGKDNDQLFGDAGNDIVWGNLGNDTLDGGDGADQVRGGQGDDLVNGGGGDDFVSGDRGNDTITGGAGADLFHDSQDAGIDRVLDFHVSEGDRVMLDPGTTYTVSQQGADTLIDMGSGNQMILVGVQASSLPPGTIFLG